MQKARGTTNSSEARAPRQPLSQIIPCQLLRKLIEPCLSDGSRWETVRSLLTLAWDHLNDFHDVAVGHGSMSSLALADRSVSSESQ
jgi:hypothetical protein